MGIRPIAICLIVHEQKILVFEGSYPEENRNWSNSHVFFLPLASCPFSQQLIIKRNRFLRRFLPTKSAGLRQTQFPSLGFLFRADG